MRQLLGAAILIACLGACNTPSVPLPPPDLPALSFQAAGPGTVDLEGKPAAQHAGVRFFVFNRTAGDGVIATAAADGAFVSGPFAGVEGDTVQIYYETPAGDRSQDVCTTLRLAAGLISMLCM